MPVLRFVNTVQLAVKSLLLHKLRSGLTTLGIVFGVFSVIAMLAIGEGASDQAQKQVLGLGATNIIVRSVKPSDDTATTQTSSSSYVLRYGLLRSDLDLLENIPTVIRRIPIRESSREVRYLQSQMGGRLVGCTVDYMDVNHLELAAGRFLTERDQTNMLNVAVIAHEVAEELFLYDDPLDKVIRVGENYYTVVGVTKDRVASAAIGGSLTGQDFNKDVYIPLRTFQVREGDLIMQRSSGSFSAEEVQLNQITLQVADASQVIPTAEVVRETLAQTHTAQKDYAVVVPLELLKQADQIRKIFNIVLGSIAAISLIVGGIGIMNIMLATVTERTREIGIRRALGARQKDISRQFLSETVVLSGAGGLIGVLLGMATPFAFGKIQWVANKWVFDAATLQSEVGRIFSEMEPKVALWSLPIAFGISVMIGVFFGMYPAISAAKLDPIEALRHE
jgi:putative ABC transport system permease protein